MSDEYQVTTNGEFSEDTIRELPVLPSKDLVLFPHMVVPWIVEPPNLVKLIDDALGSDRTIAVVFSKEREQGKMDLKRVGTIGLILRMAKDDEGHAKLIIQGVARVHLLELTEKEPYLKAKVQPAKEVVSEDDLEVQALMVNIRQSFSKVLELSPNLPNELGAIVLNITDPGMLADVVVSHLNIPPEEKQVVLEALDIKKRLEIAIEILTKQLEILELGHKIQSRVKDQMDKTQREFYLREQLKAIKKELGESEGAPEEIEELKAAIEAKKLPESAKKEVERELERLSKMHPSSAEYTVSRDYIDWILALPWHEETEDHLDLEKAEEILNQDHYDLEKVKNRIIEYLAVRKLKPDAKGPILCFAGPPGTGKTSLGRSIAKALGRKFYRIALGGVRDEAEIRGHRRTYVGAMPGRIIQGLRRVGVKNPIFMLDEIDKIGTDFRGDPASALLEVLDPEQNATFTDHYLGVEFDLSKIIFIATANVLETIPAPLLDRMEILELSGYTLQEKLEIARKYLIPRQLKAHGLTRRNVSIPKKVVSRIITDYTREAGVRNLEREIAGVLRGVAKRIAMGETEKIVVSISNLHEFLGPPRFESEVAERTRVPGVVTGLAWTPTGGEILFIEATKMDGNGKLILTGKLGDVMKESAQTALSLVRSKAKDLKIDSELFQTTDIHIHVPAGAVPKDGPSAGVATALALISLLTERPANPKVAVTGEITLRGQVLPVGGIKEKVLAAHRAGIKEVILPKRNKKDLVDVPEEVKEVLKFHFIQTLDEAINIVFSNGKRKKK
ncbi:ATP-dependent protease La Type I [Dissulfuribacter thermophilus]|uniref:Lon protease n=1 Tax=Dissulfuribacter thermophilus TaxID=1156395 RepID=A0A1B9F700_9BACT|nr:endopeptidase La [Dissulfuribacter thermophilus]OCC15717.1 ATP-dependent protease La Type I [Dissulfuribacter thermophilus]